MITIATGTGRCGTQTIAEFFRKQGWVSFHERDPDGMIDAGLKAYHDKEHAKETAKREYSRMWQWERYLESNYKFFSLIKPLYDLDNDIKFIWLVRDKKEFIESGFNRNWYNSNNEYDKYRLKPPEHIKDQKEKIEWLWEETNNCIQKQLEQIPQKNWVQINVKEFGEKAEGKISKLLDMPIACSFNWSLKYNFCPNWETLLESEMENYELVQSSSTSSSTPE